MFDNFCNNKQANKNDNPQGLICKMELKKVVVIKVHTKFPRSLEFCRKAAFGKCFFLISVRGSQLGEELFFLYLITF